jgi:hypothetical protein
MLGDAVSDDPGEAYPQRVRAMSHATHRSSDTVV